jgi:hypothetical protein
MGSVPKFTKKFSIFVLFFRRCGAAVTCTAEIDRERGRIRPELADKAWENCRIRPGSAG